MVDIGIFTRPVQLEKVVSPQCELLVLPYRFRPITQYPVEYPLQAKAHNHNKWQCYAPFPPCGKKSSAHAKHGGRGTDHPYYTLSCSSIMAIHSLHNRGLQWTNHVDILHGQNNFTPDCSWCWHRPRWMNAIKWEFSVSVKSYIVRTFVFISVLFIEQSQEEVGATTQSYSMNNVFITKWNASIFRVSTQLKSPVTLTNN